MSFPNPDDLIKPWSWNIAIEAFLWGIIIFLVALIWLWTRSGKDRKHTPDILGRNVEDFAGVAQEGNGPIPVFLLLFYGIVAFAIVGYITVTLIVGYKY